MSPKPLAAIAILIPACLLGVPNRQQAQPLLKSPHSSAAVASRTFLGFDRNEYPGDETLRSLRQSFSFAGYWLNSPPGSASKTWAGKRSILRKSGFGFLVLFNGRTDSQLKLP